MVNYMKAIIIFSVLAIPAISFAELPDGGFNFNDWTTTKPAIKATITKPESSTSSVNYWDTTSVGDGGEIPLKQLSWGCGSKCQRDDSGEKWLHDKAVNNSNLQSVRVFLYLDYLSNKAGCLLLKEKFGIDTKSGCRWSLAPNFEQKIIAWIGIRDSQINGMKNSSSVDAINFSHNSIHTATIFHTVNLGISYINPLNDFLLKNRSKRPSTSRFGIYSKFLF